jgi:hypothetical protein
MRVNELVFSHKNTSSPHNGTIGMLYSDQRDPLPAQKLAHQKTTDLVNWGPFVNDVAY